MTLAITFSSSAISGSTPGFGWDPENTRWIPPPRTQRTFENKPATTSSKWSFECRWSQMPAEYWTILYNLAGGGAGQISAPGYLIAPKQDPAGSVLAWGYYSCLFEMPPEIPIERARHYLGVVFLASNVVYLADASAS